MNNQNPTCQVCGQGELKKKKKYRMSGPVVFIGYIFLIPSIFGMLFGVLMIFATGGAASETSESIRLEVRQQLTAANIPEEIIQKVISRNSITEDERYLLSDDQRRTVSDVQMSYSASQVGAGAGTVIAGGFSIFVIVSSFVGGLLGWLLIMKKRVLQCVRCNAVIAAS